MTPIIKTEAVSHVYSIGTPFEKTAIEDVNFEVYPGECIGIIGHTGSGKSTFIQHLNGLLKPTSGKILFNGEDIHQSKSFTHDIRFKVGLVFQYPEYQLFEENVYKDIAYGPSNMKLSAEEIDRRVKVAAEIVGLSPEQLEMSPFDLSGGQKRRAAIAGIIAMHPDVLILDEPTAGLDPTGRREILANIERYRRESGAAIIFVSHSMEEMAEISDRLYVFSSGHIVLSGTPSEVYANGDYLESIGLGVPKSNEITFALRRLGLDIPAGIYTVSQLVKVLTALKGGERNA